MSRMEHHCGIAVEMAQGLNGLRAKVAYMKAMHDIEIECEFHDKDPKSPFECFVISKNAHYRADTDQLFILEHHTESEDGNCVMFGIADDSGLPAIIFTLSFYNGGGGFSEVFNRYQDLLEANRQKKTP
ncbi:hypothetical protein [uncultured Amphritea sp.]|uniref:hypothetical protein n=1 Tax=uncultured Amphritea sp. TaxID=981605 RepID=UPI00262F36EA|nr:hypothetical protein [uncultured Amphritea sp.]